MQIICSVDHIHGRAHSAFRTWCSVCCWCLIGHILSDLAPMQQQHCNISMGPAVEEVCFPTKHQSGVRHLPGCCCCGMQKEIWLTALLTTTTCCCFAAPGHCNMRRFEPIGLHMCCLLLGHMIDVAPCSSVSKGYTMAVAGFTLIPQW